MAHRARANFPRRPLVHRCSLSFTSSLHRSPLFASQLLSLPCSRLAPRDTIAPEAAHSPKQPDRWRAHQGSTSTPRTRQRARCISPLLPHPLLQPSTPPAHKPQNRLMAAQGRPRLPQDPNSQMDRAYMVKSTRALSVTFLQTYPLPHHGRLRRGQSSSLIRPLFASCATTVLSPSAGILRRRSGDRVRALLSSHCRPLLPPARPNASGLWF